MFIGDSRTVGLMEYGDLGEAEVFADTGMSAFKVMDTSVKVKSGGKKTLQEVLQDKQFGKVYIMLGLNELGYPYNSIISKYKEVVELVQQYQPDALIFLEANLHVSAKRSATSDVYNNAKINQLNDGIKQMADSSRIFYLDINSVFDDADGNLDSSYTVDDSHVLGKYYDTWSPVDRGADSRSFEQRNGFLFLNQEQYLLTPAAIRGQLKKFSFLYGINPESMHPHSFRHRFAKNFIETIGDIAFLSELLGHESIETTRIYLKRSSAEQYQIVNKVMNW